MSLQVDLTGISWKTGAKGEFIRPDSSFRNWVTRDGSSGFKAEAGRYHLYISHACPWANRTSILRALKGLTAVISLTVVDYLLPSTGWQFAESDPDPNIGAKTLRQIYELSEPGYPGKITVPVLFDKKTQKIVNNESSEIIRMLNTEFNDFSETEEQRKLDLNPEELRSKIDEINDWVYHNINNGVYKSGFATTQEAYESAFDTLFKHLDKAEEILSKNRYLTGNKLTLADIRLFTTLVRFDPVYHGHFKTNLKRIADYPNLYNYTKELYQIPEIKSTVNFEHIKNHYYQSHRKINPTGIVPKGPIIDLDSPHNRSSL